MTRAQLTNWLCREASSACKGKPPKVPADRKPGAPFKVADPQERQMAKMMASMKVWPGLNDPVFTTFMCKAIPWSLCEQHGRR